MDSRKIYIICYLCQIFVYRAECLGLLFKSLLMGLWETFTLCASHSHSLSASLFPSVGDDDNFSAVALERDTEGSEGTTVLSTGTGLAKDIFYPRFKPTLIKHQYLCCYMSIACFLSSSSECD